MVGSCGFYGPLSICPSLPCDTIFFNLIATAYVNLIPWSMVACRPLGARSAMYVFKATVGHARLPHYIDSIFFREYTVYMAGHAALNKHSYTYEIINWRHLNLATVMKFAKLPN